MKLTKLHNDSRGEINIIEGLDTYPEVTVFKTKRDYARGGCIHAKNDEFTCVIEGVVEYYIGDNKKKTLFPGETLTIPKNTPHYFISVMDSTVLEWGCGPDEKKEKHKPTREIVDKINRNQDVCVQSRLS